MLAKFANACNATNGEKCLRNQKTLITNNSSESDSGLHCCRILLLCAWITDRAFEDNPQIPQCLQHGTVLSFITSQTRTGAWSCVHFSLCDTSPLSCMPPLNPLLSQLYPSPPPSAHPHPCSIAHKHSVMPVVITVGHNFRGNLKTIYYPWSIKKVGQAFSGCSFESCCQVYKCITKIVITACIAF